MNESEQRVRSQCDMHGKRKWLLVFTADLRELLRELDEARAMSESNWILAERTRERAERAEADLARVTAERDEACADNLRRHGIGGELIIARAERDALAAKLARAEAVLDFAARTLRGEGCEDQAQAYDIAQRAIDAYFSEQWAEAEQRRRNEDERYNLP